MSEWCRLGDGFRVGQWHSSAKVVAMAWEPIGKNRFRFRAAMKWMDPFSGDWKYGWFKKADVDLSTRERA